MRSPDDFLSEIEENENGRFLVENEAGRAMLRVYPAGAKGRPVAPADVLARLELFRLQGVDKSLITALVESPDGRPHDIGAWPEATPVDAVVKVKVAEDEMRAWLHVEPPRQGGRPVNEAAIRAALAEAG